MEKSLFNPHQKPRPFIIEAVRRNAVNRILVMLFAIMLIPQGLWAQDHGNPTYYYIWIGATQISSDNNTDVFNDGTVSYNPDAGILTLTNAQLTDCIYTTKSDLIIHFVGDCKIEPTDYWINNCIVSSANSGTLKFTKSANGDKLVISTRNSRQHSIIRGFSSLDGPLETDEPYVMLDDSGYKRVAKRFRIDGDTTGIDYAIISADEVYPLWVNNTQVTSTTKSDILTYLTSGSTSGTVSYDSDAKKLELAGASFNGKILSGLDELTISVSGSNTITSSDSGTVVRSYNKRTLKLSKASEDATLALKINDVTSTYPVIQGFNSLLYSDFSMTTPSGTSPQYGEFTDPVSRTLYGLYNSTDNKGILTVSFAIDYDLWVNGKQVTSANADNVFNKNRNSLPTVSFNVATSTLTLNGEGISVNTTSGIKSGLTNLNVYLVGATFPEEMNVNYPAFEGVTGSEKITFQTDETNPGSLGMWSMGYFKNIEPVYQNGLAFFAKGNNGYLYNSFSIKLPKWSGKGQETDPYKITNYTDLQALADFVNNDTITSGLYFRLENNLNCSGATSFSSIGKTNSNKIYSFDGTFDGNNKTITGLTSPYGLFAFVGGNGVVKNLTLNACQVQGGSTESAAAGLVADIRGSGTKIDNCKVVGGTISNGDNAGLTSIGGLVGYSHSSNITNCSVEDVTITQGGALTYDAGAAGLVGRNYYGGTISGCSVVNTQISASTTGSNPLYAGAIVGWRESPPPTLSNNTYDANVIVQTQVGSDPAITKSGNDHRGLGDGDDIIPGAELTGTYKINLSSSTKGAISVEGGYYTIADDNSYALAVPYSVSNQQTIIKATANAGYDKPSIGVNKHGSADGVTCTPATGTPANVTSVAFNMPSYEVDASATYPVNFSNANRTFTISNPAGGSKVYDGNPVSISEIKTTLNSTEITLTLGTDFTIANYQDDKGTTITTGAPSDAGSYKVVISGAGDNSGMATIPFTISPKSLADNSIEVSVTGTYTYDNNAKTPTLTVKDGSNPLTITTDYSVSYQKKGDNGTYTNVTEVKEAGTYKAVVTGANNYQDEKSSNDFSVGKANITGVTVSITGWTYGEAANSPSVTAGNPGNATVKYEYKQQNAGDETYTETVPADADTYTVRATVPATQNYKGANGTTTFTIGKRVVALDWTNLSFDYDGNEHKPTATVSNKVGSDVCTVTVTGGQTNAGNNYTATASALSNNNYTLLSATALTTNFDINQREVTLTWSNTEFVYDGNPHVPTAEVSNKIGLDVCDVTVNGGQTQAGDYTATASALSNNNYKLPSNPTMKFTIKDRTASITFNAGQKYKTFYSGGENLLVPDNVKAYVVTGVAGNTVNITPISYIHANAPVLLESSSGATTVKDPNETLPTNLLKYASNDVTPNGKQYVLYSGEFVRASGTIPTNKVYLDLSGSSSPARSYTISTDNTTAIEGIFDEEADGEEKWYDMQGRRINKPTKAGLYIKNGQKVVVKNK